MFYIEKRKSRFLRRFVLTYLVILLAGLAFLGGLYVGDRGPERTSSRSQGGTVKGMDKPPPYLLQNVDFDLLWDVWNLAKERYIDQPVFDTTLFYGALSGIIASLGDPYSVFLDPELTQKFTTELAGKFEGIGAEIGVKQNQLVIVAPLPDTPAQRAGVQPGDAILKIDEKDTLGMPLDVAVSNIRGPKETSVILRMMRNGWKEPRDVQIVRDTIHVKSVIWKELQDGMVHLKVIYFNETTPALFEEAVREILLKDPKGIILDLRNNPGGFFEVGLQVASQWVPKDATIVFQEMQGRAREAFTSHGPAHFEHIPTVVLVNRGSASASEIVAGAIQDYKLGTIVGEVTFGKGSVQTFEQLRGGSSIKITVAHWLTPNGRQIDETGITPDHEVELDEEDYENDRDPQLDRAIELLKK